MRSAPTFSLPPAPPVPARSAVPFLAFAAPAVGAVAMWMLTGSVFSLWFAALGPLMALASFVDGRRAARRARRGAAIERRRAGEALREEVRLAHREERDELRARHPDLVAYAEAPREIWRPVPGRAGTLVVGRGSVPSSVRVTGDDAASADLRDEAAWVPDAPVLVPATAGIAVVGPAPYAEAVSRGLALQLLCQYPVGTLTLGTSASTAASGWARAAPHRAPGPLRLQLAAPFEPGSLAIATVPPGALPPPECAAVLTVTGVDTAQLDHDGRVREVRVEAVAESQAQALAAALAERARAVGVSRSLPERVALSELPDAPARRGLSATIGVTVDGPCVVDLVADGPHAVVAGITGAGKSELLTTWVTAMAAGRGVDEVTFLLADFKGGTAFDRLRGLPHVTGVITDLDERGARRAIESLRAEIRHREATLAASRARDVADPAAGLPRLVIVVDEYAALLQYAPELAAVFTDVAARGRALGMHLILGTQRAAGVVREALLANCPLRMSLRVTDAADSRFLLGRDDAAVEPERGVAHIRTADLAVPSRVRVALTSDADIEAARGRTPADVRPRVPWLPPLPTHLAASALPEVPAGVVLGLADEPEHQRQRPLVLTESDGGLAVIGGPGSGRSGLLRALAAQDAHAIVVPTRPEAAWDLLGDLEQHPPEAHTLLICDDLDVLLTRFPPDYATNVVDRLTLLVRTTGLRPVISAGRVTGPAARVLELCGRRALLRMPSRLDHVAAGGEPGTHEAQAPRGRGSLDGVAVQFLDAPSSAAPGEGAAGTRGVVSGGASAEPSAEPWRPSPGVSALVLSGASRAHAVRQALEASDVSVGSPSDSAGAVEDGQVRVLMGDVEQWQRAWASLTTIRARHDLVIDAGCAAEFRLLTGDRTLPPYCEPGRGRAWLLGGGRVRRVQLPGATPGIDRAAR
jgi:S-DNA-T family DNA segregation ATPase FtsK/SpoIIIE